MTDRSVQLVMDKPLFLSIQLWMRKVKVRQTVNRSYDTSRTLWKALEINTKRYIGTVGMLQMVGRPLLVL